MNPTRKRRLWLVLAVVAAAIIATTLIAMALIFIADSLWATIAGLALTAFLVVRSIVILRQAARTTHLVHPWRARYAGGRRWKKFSTCRSHQG